MTVFVYYSKLCVLWDELDHHDPLLSCTCGDCKCNLGKAHEKRCEDDCLLQFLLGLYSDYYGTLRSTLLSREPLPSLNRALQKVIQEERICGITEEREELVLMWVSLFGVQSNHELIAKNFTAPIVIAMGMTTLAAFFYMASQIGGLRNMESKIKREEIKTKREPPIHHNHLMEAVLRFVPIMLM